MDSTPRRIGVGTSGVVYRDIIVEVKIPTGVATQTAKVRGKPLTFKRLIRNVTGGTVSVYVIGKLKNGSCKGKKRARAVIFMRRNECGFVRYFIHLYRTRASRTTHKMVVLQDGEFDRQSSGAVFAARCGGDLAGGILVFRLKEERREQMEVQVHRRCFVRELGIITIKLPRSAKEIKTPESESCLHTKRGVKGGNLNIHARGTLTEMRGKQVTARAELWEKTLKDGRKYYYIDLFPADGPATHKFAVVTPAERDTYSRDEWEIIELPKPLNGNAVAIRAL